MKEKRHSPEQIIRKLREAEGHLADGMTVGPPGGVFCQNMPAPSACTTYTSWAPGSGMARGGR